MTRPAPGLWVWVAQGFGAGRIPWAPGTFGSMVGFLWFVLLMAAHQPWIFAAGLLSSLAASVVLGTRIEQWLGEKDPGSMVLDEVAAIPICFLGWILLETVRAGGAWPELRVFFQGRAWILSLALLLAFRFFDILKPWPVRQIQAWRGGWGITADDVLAAGYVNLCYFGTVFIRGLLAEPSP